MPRAISPLATLCWLKKLALELSETDTLKIANKFSYDYHRW